jgi:adenylate kinase
MRILITGPQGSGKTTIAKKLSEDLGMCLVKTGDLIRQKALDNDDIGKSLKESLETGELSDDQIVGSILKMGINKQECENGYVIDGFPRRLSQLDVYDPHFDKVFYLDVSDEVATERMLKRGRDDDTPPLIEERLKIFHEETMRVVDYYEKQGILVRVNGEQSIETVEDDIRREIANER